MLSIQGLFRRAVKAAVRVYVQGDSSTREVFRNSAWFSKENIHPEDWDQLTTARRGEGVTFRVRERKGKRFA